MTTTVSPETHPEGNHNLRADSFSISMLDLAQPPALAPDPDAAIRFLRQLHPGGLWQTIIAIIPDGMLTARSFTNAEDAHTFIVAHNGDKNIYFLPNRTKAPMDKKPKKGDIALILFIYADLDPRADESPEQAKARYLQALEHYPLKPTIIIDSGNGLQCLWRLVAPLGPQYAARVEAISKAVMEALGAKAGTQNIDRILRLPFTVNHPNWVKREAGRVACMATLISFNDERRYTLDDFPVNEPDDGAQHAAQDDDDNEGDLDHLIRTGDNAPVGERSEKVWKATNWMLRLGYARSAILSTLLDKNNRISDHIYAQHGSDPVTYALRQITEAAKGIDDRPKIRSIEIRAGTVETFKVSMVGGGTVVVDADALSDFRWFNRASIAQIRRSFTTISAKAWNAEVDRALRVAKEPVQPSEEQVRYHGTETWKSEPTAWLVRERIPAQGIGLLSGMYSTFKSFVLLDLSGSITTGLSFLKARIIRRGGVLIFAAEGANDLPMRMAALIEHRLSKETDDPDLFKRSKVDLRRLPFSYVAHCRPLLDPKTVDWMVKIAREVQDNFQNQFGLDLVLIGIDTMSAAAGWDNENDAAQAQIVMNHLADVSKATGAFVLAADHFGKDVSAGTRGSVVKEASADAIMAILGDRDEETNVVSDTRLVLRKQRSGPQGDIFPFEARVVDMGQDADHEPLTSRVIDWEVERPEKAKSEKKTEAQLVMEEAMIRTLEAHRERIAVNGEQVDAVSEAHLRAAFRDLYMQDKPGVTSAAVAEARRRAFERMKGRIRQSMVEGVVYLWYPPMPM
jgi:hypothetical protein